MSKTMSWDAIAAQTANMTVLGIRIWLLEPLVRPTSSHVPCRWPAPTLTGALRTSLKGFGWYRGRLPKRSDGVMVVVGFPKKGSKFLETHSNPSILAASRNMCSELLKHS